MISPSIVAGDKRALVLLWHCWHCDANRRGKESCEGVRAIEIKIGNSFIGQPGLGFIRVASRQRRRLQRGLPHNFVPMMRIHVYTHYLKLSLHTQKCEFNPALFHLPFTLQGTHIIRISAFMYRYTRANAVVIWSLTASSLTVALLFQAHSEHAIGENKILVVPPVLWYISLFPSWWTFHLPVSW